MVSTVQKIVWFGEIKWDYLVTRKQQVLTRFPKGYEILYIEPYVKGKKQHWLPRRRGSITVLTIPFIKTIPPSLIATLQDIRLVRWGAAIFASVYFQLWAILLGFAGKDRFIGLSAVQWGKIAGRLPAANHFYDANDAHLDFPGTPSWLHEYLRAYLRKSEICFAVSPEIESKIADLGAQNIQLLGNGVDYLHFSKRQNTPDSLKDISEPILGYAGAMDWLDSELIQKVCQAFPDAEVVLIGPEIRKGWFDSQSSFRDVTNLRYLGRVDYDVLPAYVQSFTVALIPFVIDELTRPLNPNKLYEYSAAHKPVVSMNYSSTIDGLRDVIFVGDTHDEFVQGIEAALSSADDPAREVLARKHSWDEISKNMLASIEAL